MCCGECLDFGVPSVLHPLVAFAKVTSDSDAQTNHKAEHNRNNYKSDLFRREQGLMRC